VVALIRKTAKIMYLYLSVAPKLLSISKITQEKTVFTFHLLLETIIKIQGILLEKLKLTAILENGGHFQKLCMLIFKPL
jgi:hypothetical protein